MSEDHSNADLMKEIPSMIEDCYGREELLTDWEADFLDSIDHQYSSGRGLTARQIEKLYSIWDRLVTEQPGVRR